MSDSDTLRALGSTGLRVSKVGLGALMFGSYGNRDRSDCHRIIHRALDAGINLVDTADGYSEGESEEIVGSAIADRRDRILLSTKVGMRHPALGADAGGTSRRWIMRAVEASLRRLNTDYIDLYQLHSFDVNSPIDETLQALTDLVDAGKVRYVGSSNFPVDRIVEAQWASERGGTVRLCTEQLQYSLLDRRAEAALLPVCLRYDIGVLAWSPLHGGWLTDRAVSRGAPLTASPRMERVAEHYQPAARGNRDKGIAIEAISAVARDCGLGVASLALAFCASHRALSSALVGPASLAELEDVLPAMAVRLDDAVLDRLDAIVAPGSIVGVDHQTPTEWKAVPRLRRNESQDATGGSQ